MSHSSSQEPRFDAPRPRPRRQVRIEPVQVLEERKLLAPVLAINSLTATLVPATTPTNTNLGTVTITSTSLTASAAPLTSVSELTSANSFGGDVVRIKAGPGGDFGSSIYAISRGAGDNASSTFRDPSINAPINRPGVIYRVDPATGKTSVFFDLNTVLNQLEASGTANNGSSPGSGLVNNYDIAFDPEGIFDGKPSMFVSSLSQTDPNKNVVYRVGPDGSFLGLYIQFTAGASQQNFTRQPSAIYIPPVEQQSFLKGLFVGQANGVSGSNGTAAGGFQALFFNANQYSPGTPLTGDNLPLGVTATPFNYGPQVAFASANSSYLSPLYSAFTDFGTPGAGGVQAAPGLSGIQGSQGELLVGGTGSVVPDYLTAGGATPDTAGAIITPFRRFQDLAFDYYGYFSYNYPIPVPGAVIPAGTAPTYQGSLFVSDLATGLAVSTTTAASLGGVAAGTTVNIPIQGPGGPLGVQLESDGVTVSPITNNGNTTNGTNLGGRIVRVSPTGQIIPFATNFHTSGAQDATSFLGSELSISFSADGNTLYAADDDGIWQFKTVTSLADSSSGQLIGLSDLRTLGVPYNGQDSAVAIVDTGIDSSVPNFRGRVSTGLNVLTNGAGNDDTSAAATGHGTLIAGVIAQFVPQATLTPVNVFTPFQVAPAVGSVGANATTPQNIYVGLDYVAKNPFAKDPVRSGALNQTIATNIGFGTTSTYDVETAAYKKFPQITIAFKNQFSKLRQEGIQGIAPTGQFGGNTGASVGAGNVNGIVFPAVLNEVVSVTGSYPFPIALSASSDPTDPGSGVIPRPSGPVLLFGFPGGSSIGGSSVAGGSSITGAGVVSAGDQLIFKDKILNSSNRSLTTDYTAPEVDLPTFQRSAVSVGAASVTAVAGTPLGGYNDFQEGGTSLSSAVVTGSYSLVASALNYWVNIAKSGGVTADAYLNTPVGTRSLNFGANGVENLSLYANPDGINSILQWTAVPATDSPNTLDTANPPQLLYSTSYRQFARIDVGNAIAAIEGSIALNYLIQHNTFKLIDSNNNGLITAQELQNFEDNAANTGQAEAGAMARLLGGTARIPTTGQQSTLAGETPDAPDVLARRFNFFDYAAEGTLNGAISIAQYQQLSKTLLPAPDAFAVIDRQRSSANGFLLSPSPTRNYSDLKHVLPTYAFIPRSAVRRYRNFSPARFGVGRNLPPSQQGPDFTLYTDGKPHSAAAIKGKITRPVAATPATPASVDIPTSTAATTPAKTTTAATATVIPSKTTTSTGTTTATTTTTGTGQSSAASALSALTALIQPTTATTTTNTTALSATRAVGTPAAATASGVGSTETSTSTTTPTTAAEKRQARVAVHQAKVQAHKDYLATHHVAAAKTSTSVLDSLKKFFKIS